MVCDGVGASREGDAELIEGRRGMLSWGCEVFGCCIGYQCCGKGALKILGNSGSGGIFQYSRLKCIFGMVNIKKE